MRDLGDRCREGDGGCVIVSRNNTAQVYAPAVAWPGGICANGKTQNSRGSCVPRDLSIGPGYEEHGRRGAAVIGDDRPTRAGVSEYMRSAKSAA